MDPEKRDRIINAAIEEFSAFPYEKASTNNIVKNAGISKGLLFHYFGNKERLYETLIQFVIETLYREITDKIDWSEADLFDRLMHMTIVKMAVGRQYPQMFHFIMKIVLFNNTENIDEVFSLYNKYGFDFQQIYQDIFTKNIDYSKFRDQAAIPDTINIVRWSLEKYGEENLLAIGKGALDFDKVEADLARYVDIMKKAFYVQS
jgi:AcrR family transcriptional regulator